jgi:hypothetical protein
LPILLLRGHKPGIINIGSQGVSTNIQDENTKLGAAPARAELVIKCASAAKEWL